MFKRIINFVLAISCVLTFAQTVISVPFTNGFLGTYAGSNNSPVAYSFGHLGIRNVRFTQNSTSGQFVGATQGNDIPGNVVLIDNNNVQHTIPGFINWRGPSGTVTTMAFLPNNGVNVVVATNGNNGASTYTIKGGPATPYTAIGLTFNGRTLSLTEGGTFTGNAATSGLLSDLNSYLNEFPKLSINNVNATEGPGTTNAVLTVTLTGTNASTVTVDYTTADNTAVSGTNYVTTSGTLSFPAGNTTRTSTISVPIVDNTQADNNKTFYVNLSNPTNASIIGTTGTVTILDADTGSGSLSTIEASQKLQFFAKQNRVVDGILSLEYKNQKSGVISLFDTTGKAVRTITLNNSNGTANIDVSNLPKGMYIAVLKQQTQVAVLKVQIQ